MDPKFIFAFFGIAICLSLAFLAAWQGRLKRGLEKENLNPKDYRPFKNFRFSFWFVGVNVAPKLKKIFTNDYDRLGRTKIFDRNHLEVGHIGRKTAYVSKCIANDRSISSEAKLKKYTKYLIHLIYRDDQSGLELLKITPKFQISRPSINCDYIIDQKKYKLRSRPVHKSFDGIVDFYEDDILIGRIARVSARQFNMMVLNREINPIALTFAFELFERYISPGGS